MTVKIRAKPGQGSAAMGHDGPSNALPRTLRLGVRDHRDGSGSDRLINKFVSIAGLATHGEEHITLLDATRVVLQSGDARLAALGQHFRAVKNFLEGHCLELYFRGSGSKLYRRVRR